MRTTFRSPRLHTIVMAFLFLLLAANGMAADGTSPRKDGGKKRVSAPVYTGGAALSFDGVDDMVDISSVASTTGDFTWEAWIKTADGGTIMSTQGGSGMRSFFVWEGNIRFDVFNYGVVSTEKTYNDNQWHHVAVVVRKNVSGSSDEITFYVDGILDVVRYMDIDYFTSITNPAKIGLAGGSEELMYFNGSIDEVRIWNVARTEAQIQADMVHEISAPQSNLQGYFKFNQGAPDGNNTGISTVQNEAAPGTQGYLQNFSLSGTGSNWTTETNFNSQYEPFITSASAGTICAGNSIAMMASFGRAYQWYKDGVLLPGETGRSYTAADAGLYTVDVTPATGPAITSTGFTVTFTPNTLAAAVSSSPSAPGCNTPTGTISITPSGGSGDYTIQSSNHYFIPGSHDLEKFNAGAIPAYQGQVSVEENAEGFTVTPAMSWDYAWKSRVATKTAELMGENIVFEASFRVNSQSHVDMAFGFFNSNVAETNAPYSYQYLAGFYLNSNNVYAISNGGQYYTGFTFNHGDWYDYKFEKTGSTIKYYMRPSGNGTYTLVYTVSGISLDGQSYYVGSSSLSYYDYSGYSSRNWKWIAAPKLSSLAPGTYSYQITDNQTGCVTTVSATVVVDPSAPPVPERFYVEGGGAYCQGSAGVNITLSGSATRVRYQLYRDGVAVGSPVAGNGGVLDFGPQLQGTYTVMAQDQDGGCIIDMNSSAYAQENGLPDATITAGGSLTFCEGRNVTLAVPDNASYIWSDGSTTRSINVAAAGTFSVTVTGYNGCVATSQQVTTATVPNTLSASAATVNSNCANENTGSVTITAAGGSGQYSYDVFNHDFSGNSLNASQFDVRNGNFTVNGSLQSNYSGNYNWNWDNSVISKQTMAFTDGSSIEFAIRGGYDAETVIGLINSTINPVTDQSQVKIGIAKSGTSYYVIRDGNWYHISYYPENTWVNFRLTRSGDYILVYVKEDGAASYNHVNTLYLYLENSTTYKMGVLNVQKPYSSSAFETKNWRVSGSSSNVMNNLAAGTYNYVVVDNVTGCTASVSATVGLNHETLPSVFNVNGGGSYCRNSGGLPVGLTGSETGITYQLLRYGNIVETTAGTGSAINFPNQTDEGNYTIVAVADATGCKVTMNGQVYIGINELPGVSISNNGTNHFCSSETRVLTSSPASSYLWSTGATSESITINTAGNYSVTITDGNGCQNTSNTIVVTVTATTLSLSATATPATCDNATDGTVTLQPSGGSGQYMFDFYNYTFSNNLGSVNTDLFDVRNGSFSENNGSLRANPINTYPVNGDWDNSIYAKNTFDFNGDFTLQQSFKFDPGTNWGTNVAFGLSDGILQGTGFMAGFYYSSGNLYAQFQSGNYGLNTSFYVQADTWYDFKVEKKGAQMKYYAKLSSDAAYTLVFTQNTNYSFTNMRLGAVYTSYQNYYGGFDTRNWKIGNNPPLSGLAPGVYAYSVTDTETGCTASVAVTVPVYEGPGALKLEVSDIVASCPGGATGSVNLTPTGGSGNYTYSYTHGFAGSTIDNAVLLTRNGRFQQTNGSLREWGSGNGSWDNAVFMKKPFESTTKTAEFSFLFNYVNGQNNVAFGLAENSSISDPNSFKASFRYQNNYIYAVSSSNGGWYGGANIQTDTWYDFKIEETNGATNYYYRQTGSGAYQLLHSQAETLPARMYVGALNLVYAQVYDWWSGYTYDYWVNAGYETKNWTVTANPQTTNLAAGTYTYSVTDGNGCSASAVVTIPGNAEFTATATVQDPTEGNCNGSVSFAVSSGSVAEINKLHVNHAFTGSSLDAGKFHILQGNFTENGELKATYSSQYNDWNNTIADKKVFTSYNNGRITYEGSFRFDNSNVNMFFGLLSQGNLSNPAWNYFASFHVSGNNLYMANNYWGTSHVRNIGFNTWYDFRIVIDGSQQQYYMKETGQSAYILLGSINNYYSASDLIAAANYNDPSWEDDMVVFRSKNWRVLFDAPVSDLCAGNYTYLVKNDKGCIAEVNFNIGAGVPVASVQLSNASCYGVADGSIAVTVTGGVAPYQYSINGGETWQSSHTFTNLGAVNYTVIVKDANAVTAAAQTVTITQPGALTATVTAQGVTTFCSGESVLLMSSSATGNTWSTGETTQTISVSAAGSYSVSVTNGNCSVTSAPVEVSVTALPAKPEITVINNCDGSSVLSTTAAGSLLWTPGNATGSSITVTNAGTYSVTQTVNGCTSLPGIAEAAPKTTPVVAAISGTKDLCSGSTTQLNNATAGGTWSSSNGSVATVNASGLVSGVASGEAIITYTVDNAGCSASASITVKVSASPVMNAVADQTACAGTTVNAISFGGTGNAYTWTNNTTSIGLPASGTGSIGSFLAVNNSGTPVTATITVVPSSAPATAYVANYFDGKLMAMDPVSGATLATITVGTYPYGVSLTPDGSKVYVANLADNKVSVVNTATNTLETSIPMGNYGLKGIAIHPDGSKVYIPINYSNKLSVISTATNTITANITIGTVSSGPSGVAVSADGSRVYAITEYDQKLFAIDAATNTVIATVPVGINPLGVAVSPDGSHIYVANYGTYNPIIQGTVTVIRASDFTVEATVNVGQGPWGIAISPDNSKVYVTNSVGGNVSVINAATNTVTATIANGFNARGINLSADGGTMYLAAIGRLVTVNTATNAVVNNIFMPGNNTFNIGNFIKTGTGCTGAPVTFTITVNPKPAASVTAAGSTTFCAGGSVVLSANEGNGLSYQWQKNGVAIANAVDASYTASTAGNYTVVVTNSNGCSSTSAAVTVTVNAMPAAVVTVNGPAEVCTGSTVNLSANAGAGYSYKWFLNGELIPGATNMNYTATVSGAYTVEVTSATGCATTSAAVTATVQDIISPVVLTKNVSHTITTATGPYTLTVADIDNGSYDNCTILGKTLSGTTTFDCSTPSGVYGVTLTVTDLAGNSSSATATVTITNACNRAPVIQCAPVTVNAAPGTCAAAVTAQQLATATDPDGDVLTYTLSAAGPFTVGTHTVTVTVTDSGGLSASCTTTITVKDNQAPVPVINTLPQATGECSVTVTEPKAMDNCGSLITGTTASPLTYTAQGTYTIVWTYADGSGNASTQTQTVVVKDLTAPAPSVATLPVVNFECSASVTAPKATDNCAGEITATTNDATSYTAQGTYTITWKYDDGNGNITTQYQTVIVKDVTAPVPSAGSLPVVSGQCNATVTTVPTALDACTGPVTGTTTDPLTYTVQGTYTINWRYTDVYGNTSYQQQTVIVKDNIAPVPNVASLPTITGQCSAGITLTQQNSGCQDDCRCCRNGCHCRTQSCRCRDYDYRYRNIISFLFNLWEYFYGNDDDDHGCDRDDNNTSSNGNVQYMAAPKATDNCKGTIVGTTTDPLTYSTQGTHVIHWKFDDGNGNVTIQEQLVIVDDNVAPVPTVSNLPTITGQCSVTIGGSGNDDDDEEDHNYGPCRAFPSVPIAKDNCAGLIYATTTDPLTYNRAGTYIVRWTFNDGNGNIVTQNQTVIVKDQSAPKPTVKNLPTITGSCSATVNTVPTAKDNCTGIINGTTTDPLTYSVPGTYTIRWKYNDGNGNTATQTQTVIVRDETDPVPTIATLPTITGECNVTVTARPAATDNCGGPVTVSTTDPLTYTSKGTFTIRWKYTDASGNTTMQNQTVIVKDVTAPVVTAPANTTVNCGASKSPSVTGTATATDNCSGSISISYTDVTNGTVTTRTWKATDGSGNTGSAVQTITTVDQTRPVVKCPANITISCGAPVTPNNCGGYATATDNCDASPAISYLDVTIGNTITRTWTATDDAGNTNSCTQTITIVDNTKPVLTEPNDITINCNSSILPAATGMATATDNCSTPVVTYNDATSGNVITRTWKATDAAGNYTTDVQKITIGTTFSPAITSVPTNSTYTGGVANNLYLGYGAQSTKLEVCALPSAGAPYTYTWSGSALNTLSSTSSSAPVFTPVASGSVTFLVTVTNRYGCSYTDNITICVTDIRVPGTNGSKVYVCHTPAGKNKTPQTLQVPVSQVASHLSNGSCGGNNNDRLGSCDQQPCYSTTLNTLAGPTQTVTAETVQAPKAATTEEDLKITVMPNPSTTFFTLKLQSRNDMPVNLRVMDGNGRVVDARSKLGANSTLQVGHSYASGTYYAEFIQGGTRKVVQLIKARG